MQAPLQADLLDTHYEALRTHVFGRQTQASRYGLIVLLRQGLAAWVAAWSELSLAPKSLEPADNPRPPPLFDEATAEVVRILAAMTMGNLKEVDA